MNTKKEIKKIDNKVKKSILEKYGDLIKDFIYEDDIFYGTPQGSSKVFRDIYPEIYEFIDNMSVKEIKSALIDMDDGTMTWIKRFHPLTKFVYGPSFYYIPHNNEIIPFTCKETGDGCCVIKHFFTGEVLFEGKIDRKPFYFTHNEIKEFIIEKLNEQK